MNRLKHFLLLPLFIIYIACGKDSSSTSPEAEMNYRVTVSGLRGTLIISSSSTSDIVLAKDGEYLIPHTLQNGDPYSFTIKEQPPHQNCVMENAEGTIGSVVTGISVTCTGKEKNGFLKGKIITVSPGHGHNYYTDTSS